MKLFLVWSEWSSCSSSCGPGKITRTSSGCNECVHLVQEDLCNCQACPDQNPPTITFQGQSEPPKPQNEDLQNQFPPDGQINQQQQRPLAQYGN